MADGYRVNLNDLADAAVGVNGTIALFGQRPVSQIPYDPSAVGHPRLKGSVSNFLGGWQRGVGNLTQTGHQTSSLLIENLKAYAKNEKRNAANAEVIIQGTGPDPGAG